MLQVELKHLFQYHAHRLLFFDHEALQPLLERAPNAYVVLLLGFVPQVGRLGLLEIVSALFAQRRIN